MALVAAAICSAASSCKFKGCTDPHATNYNSKATQDDGTCTFDEPAGAFTITVGATCATDNGIDFSSGTVDCAACSQDTAAVSSDIYFSEPTMGIVAGDSCWGKDSLAIVSLGHVCCLGAIHELPTSGFTDEVPPGVGNGYVVKTREGNYARFYLVKFILDAFGNVTAAEIRVQYPFVP